MIKAYLKIFVYFEKNNQARLLLMAEFAHNSVLTEGFSSSTTVTTYTTYEKNLKLCFLISAQDLM